MNRRRSAGALVASLLAAALLAAQTPPAPSQQKPTFRTGVNFVRVDVYPTLNGKIVPDLKQDDFEVLEDGAAQHIETFEQVVIRAPGPESERGEPNTVQASNDAAADPRNRVFVLFLDTYHITALLGKSFRRAVGDARPTFDNAERVTTALARFLQRLIGPDDLIALMLPEMSANGLTFTRRPSSIEAFLQSGLWQRDGTDLRDLDERDLMYAQCYGPDSPTTREMIQRRHERMVLSTLQNLVVHLQSLRDERKAIVLVSEGWVLYRPQTIAGGQAPAIPRIGIDKGKPAIGDPRSLTSIEECERDRQVLSSIDDDQELRDLMQLANRANATFYPVDPRGLEAPVTAQEWDAIARKQEPLRSLASQTDGITVMNTNDFNPGLKRIADDLSSYYLLGYNSSNSKADGRFRKITVRVKRPGVAVRARPGYLAPTEADVKAAEEANILARKPDDGGLQAALAALEYGRPNRVLLLRGAYSWPVAAAPRAADAASLAVVVELDATAARGPGWAEGGQLAATIVDPDGRTLASGSAALSSTSRSCVIRFADSPLPPGEYFARVKAQWSVMTTTEQVRIVVPEVSAATGGLGQSILYRRGPYTGAGFQPTADLRFRKAERIRVDVPVSGPVDSVAGQLLDRRGQPLQVPVTAVRRDDGGAAFITADLAVAPLALGDYVIEISATRGEKIARVLTAIRIVP